MSFFWTTPIARKKLRRQPSVSSSGTQRWAICSDLSRPWRERSWNTSSVLGHIDGAAFEKLAPSPYAGLLKILRPGEPDRLIDMLLCCAAIEARSCERMTLLADALTDPALKALYSGLLASEARHFMLYVDLALQIESEDAVRTRLDEVMQHEAEVLFLSGSGPRMHN